LALPILARMYNIYYQQLIEMIVSSARKNNRLFEIENMCMFARYVQAADSAVGQ